MDSVFATSRFTLTLLLITCFIDAEWGQAQTNSVPDISIDGSSTVFPVTNAIADYYMRMNKNVHISVNVSGTGGGFQSFIAGTTDINNSSRTPTDAEREKMHRNQISMLELNIASDGIAVVTHPQNSVIQDLTVDELRSIWRQGSTVTYWSDIRPEWPHAKINLYGPGQDSGTRDYFEEAILNNGETLRSDYVMSENDEKLVKQIRNDVNGLSFFGLAYYHKNKHTIKSIAINNGSGPVSPTYANVKSGTYKPLVRTLYLHVNTARLSNPKLMDFLLFYLRMAPNMVRTAGYVPFSHSVYKSQYNQLKNRQNRMTSK